MTHEREDIRGTLKGVKETDVYGTNRKSRVGIGGHSEKTGDDGIS